MGSISLVTGGAGFIGSHLVDELVRSGKSVRILDNFSTGLRENISRIGDQVEWIDGSITDPKTVSWAVHGVEHIYHLAALASVARSVENPLATHETCVTGTLLLLDAARKAKVKRVIYAGSSSAYGGSSSEEGQKESQLPATLSPYAAAKLAGELYLQAFAATYGLETVRLRFFNIFGPRQRFDSPYSGVIALFINAMSSGNRPTIYGDGLQSRDFTYVGNAVQALIKAAHSTGVSGNVYNVGMGENINLIDLVANLNQLLGTRLEPIFNASRSGDVRFSRADIQNTKRDLGYQPMISFYDGLQKTLEWYQTLSQKTPLKACA